MRVDANAKALVERNIQNDESHLGSDPGKRQRGTGVGTAARSLEEEENHNEGPKDDVRTQDAGMEITKK